MSNYTDNLLSLLLDNYWNLYEGIVPIYFSSSADGRSPYETAMVLKCDVDRSINDLFPDRWYDVTDALDAYYGDGINPRDYFIDDKKAIYKLNRYQHGIVRYHLLENKSYYMVADRARKMMLRYLNTGIRNKDYELVDRLLKSLDFNKVPCKPL